MPRLVITRPNGDTEYAELTSDKTQAGENRLIVQKDGTDYWAKLDKEVSTHMYVIKPNGEKYYVQKEIAFTWKYVVDDIHSFLNIVIPKTGKYRLTYEDDPQKDTGEAVWETEQLFEKDTRAQQGDGYPYIVTKDDTHWFYKEADDNGEDPENVDVYEEYEDTIISIEYIGDA